MSAYDITIVLVSAISCVGAAIVYYLARRAQRHKRGER